ncbi:hypothetical protein EGJ34_08725 [Stenotrophomonas sp. 278]|nr:hypothetical protein EGJ34_08725 [Stenotrophomonas sp. 278]
MLTRALIVVLAILNVGVALWWMLRGEPVPTPVEAPAGVARLQFLDTPPAAAAAAAPPRPAARPSPPPPRTPGPPPAPRPARARPAPSAH